MRYVNVLEVQRLAKVDAPSCVIAAGKLGQSSNKIHQTWCTDFSRSLYICRACRDISDNPANVDALANTLMPPELYRARLKGLDQWVSWCLQISSNHVKHTPRPCKRVNHSPARNQGNSMAIPCNSCT